MKENTNMSRITGQLQKMFRALNEHLFENKLEMPMITVTPTPRAYGHYTAYDAWTNGTEGKREINIGSGTLNRPLEEITATLLHEMCHMYNDTILKVQDCSNNAMYHNKYFKQAAEEHGLNVEKVPRYGWTLTSLNDDMFMWIAEHDEFREFDFVRPDYEALLKIGTGTSTTTTKTGASSKKGHSIKYQCPACGNSCRATKQINIVCGDCMVPMVEVSK